MKELGLPTLEYRRQRADLIQCYRLLNNTDLTSISILKISNSRSTRGKSKLYKDRFNTETRRNSYSCRVLNTWNNLPQRVVDAPTVNSFKSRLISHWVARCVGKF